MLFFMSSWKHLCTKITPDFHLTYSNNGGNLGSVLNDRNGYFSIKSYVVVVLNDRNGYFSIKSYVVAIY